MSNLDDVHGAELARADALLWQVARALAAVGGLAWLAYFWKWVVS